LSAKSKKRTDSELLFEQYLNSLGHHEGVQFEYEEDIGHSTRPDYRFGKETPPIVFEVKSFSSESRQSRAISQQAEENAKRMAQGKGFGLAMHLNQYKEQRAKVEKARVQFKAYRHDHVCIPVLDRNTGFLIDFEPRILAGSLFGDVTLVTPRGGGKSYWTFGSNGILQPQMNTSFSAVCALDVIKPDHKKLMDIFQKEYGSISETLLECGDFPTFSKLCNEISDKHGLDPERKIVKATVIMNPHARISITPQFFSGEYDEVWGFDKNGGFVKL